MCFFSTINRTTKRSAVKFLFSSEWRLCKKKVRILSISHVYFIIRRSKLNFFRDLKICRKCCFKCPIKCCFLYCGKYLLKDTENLPLVDRLVLASYKVVKFWSPLVFTILKIISLYAIVNEYESPPIWLNRDTMMIALTICWRLLLFFSVTNLLMLCLPLFSSVDKLDKICQFHKRKSLVSRWFSQAEEISSICSDATYIIGNVLYIILTMSANCFQVSATKPSVMDSFFTKSQKLVIIPSLVFIFKFVFAWFDVCKGKDGLKAEVSRLLPALWLLADVFKAVLIPMAFSISVFEFILWTEGFCALEIFAKECSSVSFTVSVTSHVRYSLDSTVEFPNVGKRTRSKAVDIMYETTLHNQSYVPNATVCAQISDTFNEVNDELNLKHCESDPYSIETNSFQILDTKHFSTSQGISLEWPCEATMKLRKIRENVDCRYRLKVQLNTKFEFVFNYDYVYKLPESASGYTNGEEWNKRSKYAEFHSIFNTDGEEDGFREFKNFFKNVDAKLANHKLDTTHVNLLAHEPVILHIECNRSCFCYNCIAGNGLPSCKIICPNLSVYQYKNFTEHDFCKSNNPDGCQNTWKPVSTIVKDSAMNYSDLVTAQSPPTVTVLLAGKSIRAKFDHKVLLSIPGENLLKIRSTET